MQVVEKAMKPCSGWLERALPMLGVSRADRFSHARLETNNDESRFGLTRAPFSQRRGSL